MLAARVPKGKAEGLRKYLKRKGLLSGKYKLFGGDEFIYFPLALPDEGHSEKELGRFGARIVKATFKKQNRHSDAGVPHGYELYGNIAVIETEAKGAKVIARRLMRANKNVKTVLRKGGAVHGKYRTRKFAYVAGTRNYTVEYRENNCLFRFDIRKVFFSTKLAYERKRVSELVRDGEKVIVMFAGAGPYAIEIAKLHKNCKVVAIELSPAACRYARENAKINKTPNVAVECGSVEKFASKYARFADRIIMPLPKSASLFLGTALKMGRRGCTIHYYCFCPIGCETDEIKKVAAFFEGKGRKFRPEKWRAVRPYSHSEEEIVIDFVAS